MKHRAFRVVLGVVALLAAGLIYAWPVISRPIKGAFPEWSETQLSLTFTILMSCFCLGGLTAGFLSRRLSTRLIMLLGGVLFLGGFALSTLASPASALPLWAGFGLLCGFGAGFAYNDVMSTVTTWFPDRHGLVSGILLMGFGLSSLIYGKIYAAVTPEGDPAAWKSTFLCTGLAVVILLALLSIVMVRPPKDFALPPSAKRKLRPAGADTTPVGMMSTATFWLYYIWTILIGVAGLSMISQLRNIAPQTDSTITVAQIAVWTGVFSIVNACSRVIFGMIYDRFGFKVTMLLDTLSLLLASGFTFLALSQHSLTCLGFAVGLAGMGYGAVTSVNSALPREFWGAKYFPVNFPIINSNLIPASFAALVAGILYDKTHDAVYSAALIGAAAVLGIIVTLFVRTPKQN